MIRFRMSVRWYMIEMTRKPNVLFIRTQRYLEDQLGRPWVDVQPYSPRLGCVKDGRHFRHAVFQGEEDVEV